MWRFIYEEHTLFYLLTLPSFQWKSEGIPDTSCFLLETDKIWKRFVDEFHVDESLLFLNVGDFMTIWRKHMLVLTLGFVWPSQTPWFRWSFCHHKSKSVQCVLGTCEQYLGFAFDGVPIRNVTENGVSKLIEMRNESSIDQILVAPNCPERFIILSSQSATTYKYFIPFPVEVNEEILVNVLFKHDWDVQVMISQPHLQFLTSFSFDWKVDPWNADGRTLRPMKLVAHYKVHKSLVDSFMTFPEVCVKKIAPVAPNMYRCIVGSGKTIFHSPYTFTNAKFSPYMPNRLW